MKVNNSLVVGCWLIVKEFVVKLGLLIYYVIRNLLDSIMFKIL